MAPEETEGVQKVVYQEEPVDGSSPTSEQSASPEDGTLQITMEGVDSDSNRDSSDYDSDKESKTGKLITEIFGSSDDWDCEGPIGY